MKRSYLFFLLIPFIFSGCSEDDNAGPGLVGTWLRVGHFYSVGGPMIYKSEITTTTIEFFDNGLFKTNDDWCGDAAVMVTGVYTIDQLKPVSCNNLELRYEIDGDDLIIRNMLCIEGCGIKFTKVD